jgi:rhodanese-related sulfurtransferase
VNAAGVAEVEEEIDYITIKEAEEIINSQNVVVLDVRSRAEYEPGHIAGAKLMPVSEFLEDRIDGLDKDKTIIVYCGSGGRSEKACEILVQHGFKNVYNMLGGITTWIDAGLPTSSFLNTQTFRPNNNSLSSEIDDIMDDKPVFVFFYADWCHFCHQQMPIINELEQEYAGRLDFIYIDINEKQDFASEFRVNGVPTMFIISGEDEQFIKEVSGFTSKTRLKEIIDLEIGQNEVDNNEILISALSRDLGIFPGSYKNLLILTLVLLLLAVLICFFSNLFKFRNFFKKLGYKKEGLAKLLLIFLIVGVLITSFVYAPSVFAGGTIIHEYIADETAKKVPQVHSPNVDPSDKIFRNGAVMGDLGIAYYLLDLPRVAGNLRKIMGSKPFTDKLFALSETDEERAWATGMECHRLADVRWSWTGPTSEHPPGYIQNAGIYKYWGTGEIREWYFKVMNDLAVKSYTNYTPELGHWYCYPNLLIDAYNESGGEYELSSRKVRWAAGTTMTATSLYHEALGNVPYKLLVPGSYGEDLIVVLFPFIKYQLDHPCVTCAGTCWPWPCCDLKFTIDNWNYLPDGSKGYVPKSVDASTEALIELYRERPEVTRADFRPIVLEAKAEKSERPYTENLWPHVYAYTENIGTQPSKKNVWTSYNFSGKAKYDRSSECPGSEFKGDVCWKQLSSTESLINDPENQYHCVGFMSQNWEKDNDDMVGLKCIAYRDGNIWKGKLNKDCDDCDNPKCECTFLCFNKKTLGAGECSESFKGDVCWKQKIVYKETGKEGRDPKNVPLVKFDPDNKYKCIGFMSQNWEKDNDDMVGLGCTIEREHIHKGVLAKDWHCAETGPGQCTYLCLNGKVLGRYNKEEDIPGCLGGLFLYDNIISLGDTGTLSKPLVYDPNNQYHCLGFMSQNWDNIPETKGKKNDEFVGLKCLAYRDGNNWMGKLQKSGKDSELERSECSFLCINKQWRKCYSDPPIPVGEKGETIRAFFPASPGTITFGMFSDSKILKEGIPPGGFREEPYPDAEMNNYAEYRFDWDPDLKTNSITVEPSRYGYYVEVGDCVKIKANFSSSKPNVNIHAKFYIDGIEIADVPVKFGSQLKIEKEVTWLSDCDKPIPRT